jgi:hypothetical protein
VPRSVLSAQVGGKQLSLTRGESLAKKQTDLGVHFSTYSILRDREHLGIHSSRLKKKSIYKKDQGSETPFLFCFEAISRRRSSTTD